jgi:hypothetical protein
MALGARTAGLLGVRAPIKLPGRAKLGGKRRREWDRGALFLQDDRL